MIQLKNLKTVSKMILITHRGLFKIIPKLNYGAYKMSSSFSEIPKSKDEYTSLMKSPVPTIADSKVLKVAILGTPNAGKSTLINQLLNRKVCSVSTKVHTTQKNTLAFLTKDKTQIAILDTPGIISLVDKRKHNLDVIMLTAPGKSAKKADLIVCLVDVSNIWTRHRLDLNILQLLEENEDRPSILVLNKVDEVKQKHKLLDLSRLLTNAMGHPDVQPKRTEPPTVEAILRRTKNALEKNSLELDKQSENVDDNQESENQKIPERKGWPHFKETFMISALNGDGVEDLKNYFFECARPGKWMVNPNLVTDQTPKEIAMSTLREKLLNKLPHQIPYSLKLHIEFWEDEGSVLSISMKIISPEKRYLKYIIGPAGETIKYLADETRQDLSNIFHCEVSLKLIASADN